MSQTTPINTPPSHLPPPPVTPPRERGAAGRPTPALVASGGGRQRRWSLALLAVLLTVGSGLGFVVLWMNAGQRKPVLAAARDITAGQEIQEDDLVTVRASIDSGIDPLPASAADDIVGQVATVDMVPGTLILPDAVGQDPGFDAGMGNVSIPMPQEKLPSDLDPGDTVLVFDARTDSATDGSSSASSRDDPIAQGRVDDIRAVDDIIRVSIIVDQNSIGAILQAIESETVNLAVIPNG